MAWSGESDRAYFHNPAVLAVPGEGLRFVIEENQKLAKVAREISVDQVAEFSILRAAQKELGTTRDNGATLRKDNAAS